jgi:hypothetical protein
LDCPFNGQELRLNTRKCCGHFFASRIPSRDRRAAAIFVTNVDIVHREQYGYFHPVRLLARALLRRHDAFKELAIAEEVLLGGWIERNPRVHHELSSAICVSSLEELLSTIPGQFIVTVSSTQDEGRPVFHGHSMVTLVWIAPWAAAALRIADFYELDCSFRALRPLVYSVPMAVCHNVGIPLGIVVAPTERSEVYAMFAKALSEHAMVAAEELRRWAVLSDEGTALAKYASLHLAHFLCFRHLLECLGSSTIVAVLAARLLVTLTKEAFEAILPQTLSDFAFACREGLVTAQGKKNLPSCSVSI